MGILSNKSEKDEFKESYEYIQLMEFLKRCTDEQLQGVIEGITELDRIFLIDPDSYTIEDLIDEYIYYYGEELTEKEIKACLKQYRTDEDRFYQATEDDKATIDLGDVIDYFHDFLKKIEDYAIKLFFYYMLFQGY